MVELVDTQVLGTCGLAVRVRVPLLPPSLTRIPDVGSTAWLTSLLRRSFRNFGPQRTFQVRLRPEIPATSRLATGSEPLVTNLHPEPGF